MNKVFKIKNVAVNLKPVNKEQAIRMVGNHLLDLGYISEPYIQSMLNREKIVTTYIGNYIAIPHGEGDSAKYVKSPGVVIHHYQDPILDFDGPVNFVVGIASNGTLHLEILANIAEKFSDIKTVEKMIASGVDQKMLFNFFKVVE